MRTTMQPNLARLAVKAQATKAKTAGKTAPKGAGLGRTLWLPNTVRSCGPEGKRERAAEAGVGGGGQQGCGYGPALARPSPIPHAPPGPLAGGSRVAGRLHAR